MSRLRRIISGTGAAGRLCMVNATVSLLIWLSMGAHALFGFSDAWMGILFGLPADFGRFLHQPWTLVSYMFTQADPLQLIFNMLWLMVFGKMLSDLEPERRIYGLYLWGGITGGIFYLIAARLFPAPGHLLTGSSAAVLSVMTYTALRQPDRRIGLWLIGEVKLKWIALVTVCITLMGGTGPAAHCAHIGGVLYPLLVLLAERRKRLGRPSSATKTGRKLRVPAAMSDGMLNRRLAAEDHSEHPEAVLDRLLDKIRLSGYDSLSADEKKLLDTVSKLLDNDKG